MALAGLKELIVSINRVGDAEPCIFNATRRGIGSAVSVPARATRFPFDYSRKKRGSRRSSLSVCGGRLRRETSEPPAQ